MRSFMALSVLFNVTFQVTKTTISLQELSAWTWDHLPQLLTLDSMFYSFWKLIPSSVCFHWVLTNWRREGSCLQYLLKSHCDPQLGYQKYSNQDIHLPLPLSRWFLSLTQPTCNTKIRYMLRPIVTSVNNYWGMLISRLSKFYFTYIQRPS